MANTTNFNWETPDDTDLVKDGAAAIRTLGNSIDTSFVDLKGGTTGQVLSKASNTDLDFTWVAQDDSNAIQNAIVDAKGDLISATAADTPARLAVGTDGQVLQADSTQATGLKWTSLSSGITWTGRIGIEPNGNIKKIAYGNNLYVAAGEYGYLFTSSDGITWTSRTSGFGTNNIQDVHYVSALSLWVAVGVNGTITTSSDGITWTARTSNMSTNEIKAVTSSGSTIVAVGEGGGTTNTGGITYSTDGITWTRKSQSLTVGPTYYSITYNGTNWVIGASHSTNNHLYASTPSGTWTVGATGSAGNCIVLAWDGTKFTTLEGASGDIRYSTSTSLGTTNQIQAMSMAVATNDTNSKFFTYYNGRIYFGRSGFTGDFATTYSQTGSTYFALEQAKKDPMPGDITTTGNPNAYYVGSAGRIMHAKNIIWTSF
jgi:hypothetical protein